MTGRLINCELIALAGLLGCGKEQVLCRPLTPLAVAVDVRDSVNNSPLVPGARGVVLKSGIVEDSLRPELVVRLFPESVLVGGHSEGSVEVRVERDGYLPWSLKDVPTRLQPGLACPVWDTRPLTARLRRKRS
jgi:hypothetical protein